MIKLYASIAGPWAAGLLADFGAEVIKVEMPGRGDAFRGMGPLLAFSGMTYMQGYTDRPPVSPPLHWQIISPV
ncbi:CoA transferase [uncultured Oscillibacter sp.]|uniref:CoA transferase n=1 Tax=uncultured Oscillibacter sp. TaxID=876091 RepID=UPI0026008CF0|nr:CoA transferase [uncultured Oscillibacter sp.]